MSLSEGHANHHHKKREDIYSIQILINKKLKVKQIQKYLFTSISNIFKDFAAAWRGILISISLLAYAISSLPGYNIVAFFVPIPFLIDLTLNHTIRVMKQLNLNAKESNEKTREIMKNMEKKIYRAIEMERSDRIYSFARRDSGGELPRDCLILLTVPRSGSTWLMDAIRCHPRVNFDPRAIILEQLGLKGSRYPIGLSNGPDATIDIEIDSKRGAQIPVFSLKKESLERFRKKEHKTFAIEKIHPVHFNYDTKTFIGNIERLEQKENIEIKFIYQVRDPKCVIASFLNYKTRDPTWWSHVTDDQLPSIMGQSYADIYELARFRKGLIIDYSELVTDFRKLLVRIYKYLWPDEKDSELFTLADEIMAITDRGKRTKLLDTPFLGVQGGSIESAEAQYSSLFAKKDEDIDFCYESYRALLKI